MWKLETVQNNLPLSYTYTANCKKLKLYIIPYTSPCCELAINFCCKIVCIVHHYWLPGLYVYCPLRIQLLFTNFCECFLKSCAILRWISHNMEIKIEVFLKEYPTLSTKFRRQKIFFQNKRKVIRLDEKSLSLGRKNSYRILTEFGLPMWQDEADTELTLSALPATAVGQILLTMAKFC